MYYSRFERKENATEARARRKKYAAAYAILDKLVELPPDDIASVPALFAAAGKPGDERYEIFRLLDENGGYFGYEKYGKALALLRSARNTPSSGRALFAVINGRSDDSSDR